MSIEYSEILKVARLEVRSEHQNPASSFYGYDRQPIVFEVLNGVPGLTNSDADGELILEAIREAEAELGIDATGSPVEAAR